MAVQSQTPVAAPKPDAQANAPRGGGPTAGLRDDVRRQPGREAQQALVSPDARDVVVVQPGDTLTQIAQRELGDGKRWPEIVKLNGLSATTVLRPGQRLRVPGTDAAAAAPTVAPPTAPVADKPAGPAPAAPRPDAAGKPKGPAKGGVTFDAEGSADPRSPYYSRRPHWPGGPSGVTIGRGYDMKERSAKEIVGHLTTAGIDEAVAKRLGGGSKLTGKAAEAFVKANRDVEIGAAQEIALFQQVYDEKDAYAAGCVKRWSGTDWNGVSQAMKDILVDLFYRGDMTRDKWDKQGLAAIVAANNLTALMLLLFDRSAWGNIDTNRYIARMDAVAGAIKPTRDMAPSSMDAAGAERIA